MGRWSAIIGVAGTGTAVDCPIIALLCPFSRRARPPGYIMRFRFLLGACARRVHPAAQRRSRPASRPTPSSSTTPARPLLRHRRRPGDHDLDTGVHPGWTRTGYRVPGDQGRQHVRRHVAGVPLLPARRSTRTSIPRSPAECDDVKAKFSTPGSSNPTRCSAPSWSIRPRANCPADTTHLRLYNNRADANHRYTDQMSVYLFMMVARVTSPEGDGNPPLPVAFCTPTGGDIVPTAPARHPTAP